MHGAAAQQRRGQREQTAADDEVSPRPSIYCPTDARQIAEAYAPVAGQGTGIGYFVDCQEGADGEFPLEDATLAPEYRCTIDVQLGTNEYQLICEPL